MLEINIDTSKRMKNTVSLLIDGSIKEEITGDLDVTVSVRKLLLKNKFEVTDIDKVTFYKGPGSFTGLKTGSAISNVMNWALKLSKISELEYPEYGGEPNIQL